MIQFELHREDGILIVTPLGHLEAGDFVKLVREVDPFREGVRQMRSP